VLYLSYVVLLYFNRALLAKMHQVAIVLSSLAPFSYCVKHVPDLLIPEDDFSTEIDESLIPSVRYMDSFNHDGVDLDDLDDTLEMVDEDDGDVDESHTSGRSASGSATVANNNSASPSPSAAAASQHSTSKLSFLGWLITIPFRLLFRYTIPPIKGYIRYQYYASFAMSTVWMAALTYLIVYWAHRAGCLLGITDNLLGVTVLAIGTSLPEALTAISAAKGGRGNMAISNALVCSCTHTPCISGA
jgi:Ca2+/Na+ antiporter